MITTDIPIYTEKGDITRLSRAGKSSLGRFKAIETTKPESLTLLKTASFGGIMISNDSSILRYGSISRSSLYDWVQLNVNLEDGSRSIPLALMNNLENQQNTPEAFALIKKNIPVLLKLNVFEKNVAFKYLWRLFKTKKEGFCKIRCDGHAEIARCLQILGWKVGYHSTYLVYQGTSYLQFKSDCSLTEIDYDNNKITSKIVELKVISKFSRGTKFYKLSSTDLPVIPTVAGTFCF